MVGRGGGRAEPTPLMGPVSLPLFVRGGARHCTLDKREERETDLVTRQSSSHLSYHDGCPFLSFTYFTVVPSGAVPEEKRKVDLSSTRTSTSTVVTIRLFITPHNNTYPYRDPCKLNLRART